MEAEMATFVLVHGAWHGGWCWRRVADRLRAGGHTVFTPTLSGVGERSHQLSGSINLSTHITDVVNVLKWEGLTDVVLCGHSYGGMVITGAADAAAERVRSLVYLDAFLPQDGERVLDFFPPEALGGLMAGTGSLGGYALPPVSAERFQVNAAGREWVDRLCTPQPLATFLEAISLTGAHERISERTYIYAEGWAPSGFTPIYERLKADPGWTVHSVPCGHDVMVDMPEELARLLVAAI
jgi:pimeloyl-ACP methyl ester carboxylesterase